MTPSADRKRRQNRYWSGRRAEMAAQVWLRFKGYRVLAKRVRNGAGEIDLIARKGRLIAFVEIKARARLDLALEAVTPRAQKRIARAAEIWMASQPDLAELEQRFDIVAMRGIWMLAHICDAWRP